MARSRLKLLFWCERGGRRAVDLYASDESVLRAADVRGLRPRQRRRSASTSRAHAAAAVTSRSRPEATCVANTSSPRPYKLAVGSFKQTPGTWDALETMFVAVGKRDAGTGDKIDDGTRHEHFAGLR
jgi:hypothetical protein